MADRGALRALRAVTFTAVCLLLTVLGHGLSAGAVPDPAAVVAGGGVLLLLAAYLAGRERSLTQITAGVLVAQASLHMLFSAVRTAPAYSVAGASPVHHTAHVGHAQHIGAWTTPGMLLAHAVAGLLAAWWLHRGETVVWELCRWLAATTVLPLRRLLGGLSTPLADDVVRDAPPAEDRLSRPAGFVLRHAVVRRGPPVAVLVR